MTVKLPVQQIRPRRLTSVVWSVLLFAALALSGCYQPVTDNFLKIGIPEEPNSLNLFLGTDANSQKILSLIYQPLFLRDPRTLDIIPWLAAKDPVFDWEKLTCTVTLKDARWSDGSDFTSEDVRFTQQLFLDFKIPKYYSKWKIISHCETPDPKTVVFHLKEASAIFEPRVLTSPIVSRKEWESRAAFAKTCEKPLVSLQAQDIAHPLGTGPFVLSEYRKGGYIHMKRNAYFFGQGKTICGMELGPFVDNILFRIYGTSDVAILALQKGDIDYYWWDIQPGYIDSLKKDPLVKLYFNRKSALYYLGFNLRKPPFNDKPLRQALSLVIDREFIFKRILQSYGEAMNTIVPSGNLYWTNPHVVPYGSGMTPDQRLAGAVALLKAAGYTWETGPIDETGRARTPSAIIMPDGREMERVVILTPPADYDPKRAFAGTMIQEWFRNLGVPAYARPMAFGALLDTVKTSHDFQAFVLGYGKLDLDPDYLRAFFYSKNDKPMGWNMSGYNNPVFDRLADEQQVTTDLKMRREQIWQMQEILSEDLPYIPLYNPDIIEAVYTGRVDGWVEKVDGIGHIWSLCCLKPKGRKQ